MATSTISLEGISFEGLTRIPVMISGGWQNRAPITISGDWLSSRVRTWNGLATASELIVALVALTHDNYFEWTKSDRGSLDGLEVGLGLFPYDLQSLEFQI